ncbi:MAG: hypothetical protein MHM6MM_009254, partial [Cercozoa sp. M6MM]
MRWRCFGCGKFFSARKTLRGHGQRCGERDQRKPTHPTGPGGDAGKLNDPARHHVLVLMDRLALSYADKTTKMRVLSLLQGPLAVKEFEGVTDFAKWRRAVRTELRKRQKQLLQQCGNSTDIDVQYHHEASASPAWRQDEPLLRRFPELLEVLRDSTTDDDTSGDSDGDTTDGDSDGDSDSTDTTDSDDDEPVRKRRRVLSTSDSSTDSTVGDDANDDANDDRDSEILARATAIVADRAAFVRRCGVRAACVLRRRDPDAADPSLPRWRDDPDACRWSRRCEDVLKR